MKTGLDTYRLLTNPKNKHKNDTLKGVLLNAHIKKQENENFDNFDKISSELLIPENINQEKKEEIKKENRGFDYKKALKPLIITTAATLAMIGTISLSAKKYSQVLATKNDIVRPGDLARNINILEEPHFAMYRALRDPNAKNILGLIGVGIMTAVTTVGKNFIDGFRDVWIKKQNCDIEYDLQENLIQVETEEFSGKLNVVNTLLNDTTKYFKSVFAQENTAQNTNFKSFISFKGKENKDTKDIKDTKDKKKMISLGTLGAIGFIGLSFLMFKNYQKTVKNLDTFVQKFEHNKIQQEINEAINEADKNKAIKRLTDILKVINAKDDTISSNLSKIKDISQEEIQKATKEIKDAQIYVSAPEALGGISEKIQYYCYVNEERGHLYNWILNPENKFNKYLFLCFSAISATGYIAKTFAQAIKDVIVQKENTKNELNLKKKLVEVEINNFKSKKLSAINPQIDNFKYQFEKGKPKEELKELAENILIEIKNGPPYIYS